MLLLGTWAPAALLSYLGKVWASAMILTYRPHPCMETGSRPPGSTQFGEGVFVLSAYLKDSEGLSDTNKVILEELAVVVQALNGPWIIGADWNLSPTAIAASKWLDIVHGVIFATELPTCHNSTYD